MFHYQIEPAHARRPEALRLHAQRMEQLRKRVADDGVRFLRCFGAGALLKKTVDVAIQRFRQSRGFQRLAIEQLPGAMQQLAGDARAVGFEQGSQLRGFQRPEPGRISGAELRKFRLGVQPGRDYVHRLLPVQGLQTGSILQQPVLLRPANRIFDGIDEGGLNAADYGGVGKRIVQRGHQLAERENAFLIARMPL